MSRIYLAGGLVAAVASAAGAASTDGTPQPWITAGAGGVLGTVLIAVGRWLNRVYRDVWKQVDHQRRRAEQAELRAARAEDRVAELNRQILERYVVALDRARDAVTAATEHVRRSRR
jgi:hypothetical protein